MYCTINFSKKINNEEYLGLKSQFNELNNFSFKGSHQYRRASFIEYNYKNFIFRLTEQKLTGIGSLTKLHHGNNIQNSFFEEIIFTLNELKNLFEIDLNDAIVTRLDIGATIAVEEVPSNYLKNMIAPIGFKTSMENDYETLYFRNNVFNYSLYDKNLEALKKNEYKTLAKVGEYKLRYELQIKKLPKFLSVPVVTWQDLYDEDLYAQLVKEWYNKFQAINFKNEITCPLPQFNSFKSFKIYIYSMGIKACGGWQEALKLTKKCTISKDDRFKIKKWLLAIFLPEKNEEISLPKLHDKVLDLYHANQYLNNRNSLVA